MLDSKGRELNSGEVYEVPAGFSVPESLETMLNRLLAVRRISEAAKAEGFETFEEAQDFDIEDDPIDPSTPYEPEFDPLLGVELTAHDVVTRDREIAAQTEKALAARKAALEAKKAASATPPAGTVGDPPQRPANPAGDAPNT